jgi:hypothetical protein
MNILNENVNHSITFEELFSCIPHEKVFMLKKLLSKVKNVFKDEHNKYKITLPHLINFVVRKKEFTEDDKDLLIILQKKLREFKKKGSDLYIKMK